MRVYKVYPCSDCNPCCEKDLGNVRVWFEEAEPGEKIVVEILEMEESDYNELPEYMGP